jgi:hypothetical protein
MEGFLLYFLILFVFSVINIWLFILCLLKVLKINVRTLYLILGSFVLAIFIFPRTVTEFVPFESIENALITLTILAFIHAGMFFLKKR